MICRIFQWRMEAQLDRDGAIRSFHLQQHLKNCPECSAWFQTYRQLENCLQKPLVVQSDPARMKHVRLYIQQRLAHQAPVQPSTNVSRNTAIRLGPVMQTAAAMVLLGAGLWIVYVSQSGHDQSGSEIAFMARQVTSSTALNPRIPQWAALPEQPIRQEVYNLAEDAQAAVTFIANCIPTHTPGWTDGASGSD